MRRVVVVAWMLALLAAAPAARADVTFGSALDAGPGDIALFDCLGSGGCTLGFASGPAGTPAAPVGGVLTRWRIRTGVLTTPARLQVLRRPASDPQQAFVVGESAEVTPPANAVSVYRARIRIEVGDHLAVCCFLGPSSYINAIAGTSERWAPPLGSTPAAPTSTGNFELLVSGDIEADVDGDGFGDETQDDCPTVSGVEPQGCPAPPPPPAAPRVNQPPVVRFRTPTSGTVVRVSQAIELDVADDAGNPTVSLFDDDGTICSLSAPPYACTWTPTGADVGRATLLASAVDSDGRSTLGIVRVSVARFEADLTRRVRGRRVSGRLVLPAAVERALGCRGEVTVRRGRTSRTVALKRNCAYSARVGRRGRVRARFGGNPVVEPAT
jgi:hypothetical protein